MQRAFKRVKMDHDQSSATQKAQLMDIKSTLVESQKAMQATKSEVQTIRSGMDFMRNLGAEMLLFMKRIWTTNILTYNAIITLQSSLPQQLERSWTQEPVTLKDPLGRVTPVHLEFIESWEVSCFILRALGSLIWDRNRHSSPCSRYDFDSYRDTARSRGRSTLWRHLDRVRTSIVLLHFVVGFGPVRKST